MTFYFIVFFILVLSGIWYFVWGPYFRSSDKHEFLYGAKKCSWCSDIGIVVDDHGTDSMCPKGCKASEPYWGMYPHEVKLCGCSKCYARRKLKVHKEYLDKNLADDVICQCSLCGEKALRVAYNVKAEWQAESSPSVTKDEIKAKPLHRVSFGVYAKDADYTGMTLQEVLEDVEESFNMKEPVSCEVDYCEVGSDYVVSDSDRRITFKRYTPQRLRSDYQYEYYKKQYYIEHNRRNSKKRTRSAASI